MISSWLQLLPLCAKIKPSLSHNILPFLRLFCLPHARRSPKMNFKKKKRPIDVELYIDRYRQIYYKTRC